MRIVYSLWEAMSEPVEGEGSTCPGIALTGVPICMGTTPGYDGVIPIATGTVPGTVCDVNIASAGVNVPLWFVGPVRKIESAPGYANCHLCMTPRCWRYPFSSCIFLVTSGKKEESWLGEGRSVKWVQVVFTSPHWRSMKSNNHHSATTSQQCEGTRWISMSPYCLVDCIA